MEEGAGILSERGIEAVETDAALAVITFGLVLA